MSKQELLDQLVQENHGVLRTSDVVDADISRTYLASYVKNRGMERVAHGIYLAADAWCDGFYLLQARWPKAIFSHEAGLYLWQMAEREPMPMTVTLPAGCNVSNLSDDGIKVYKIKAELYELGKTETLSPNGHKVYTYNPERCLCDLLRSRSQVEVQDITSAMREYVRQKDKNIPLLLRYAKELRVERILKPYLEVLLP